MSHQNSLEPQQGKTAREQVPAPMRLLTTEELLEVVGGPEIKNGGDAIALTSNVSSSIGG